MNNKKVQYALFIVALAALLFGIWKYRQPRFGAGDVAPDFEVTTVEGNNVRLSDLRGKYVILQFWGSWCGPCRQENPFLTDLYRRYHEKGLEIFSLAIDVNTRSWQNAIINDRLGWPYHAMEPRDFSGPVTTLYNIKSIPTLFLINPEGKIMGVDLANEYMDRMLSEKLGK